MSSDVVVFSYADWIARYPEFTATVTEPMAQGDFDEACLILDNTACSIVPYAPNATPSVTTRKTLLNMLTAHIAAINAATNPLVGRIESAAEGTVNVTVKLEGDVATRAWFSQTKYGLSFYQATAIYRTWRPIPGPQFGLPPYYPFGAVGWPR